MDALSIPIERHSREVLPTVTRVFIFVYLVIGCSHILLLPDHLTVYLGSLALFTFLFGVVVRFNLDSSSNHAERILLAFVLLAALNTLVHVYLTQDLKHTTNLIFVMAVCGYLLPRNQFFYPVLAAIILAWLGFSMPFVGQTSDVVHFGFEMLLGCLFAIFLQTLRRGQLTQMTSLEESVEQLSQSQQQVSASQELLQSLMDNIPAGIVVRDADTRIRYLNQEAKLLFGLDGMDPTGMAVAEDPFELYDQSGRKLEPHEWPISRVLETGEPIADQIVGGKGPNMTELRWGLVNAFPLNIGEDGDSVVVLAFTNITERVKAELLLNESETRARAILESVTEGIIAVDRLGLVTLFNPAAQRITGISESDALGRPLPGMFNTTSNEPNELEMGHSIQEGSITNQDGEEVTIELLTSDVQTDGHSVGTVYSFRDVSEQHKIEQERATMDKMTSIGVLAGGIAHDFNNLLTAIYGNVALAESSMDEPEKAADFLRRSSESIQLATNLTKQLLTFSTGSDPLRTSVDIERLVREAARFSLSGSSIVATYEIDENLKAVEVDAGQVQQAISNIVLNAKQAMQDVGTISISMKNLSEDLVEVVVSDEGPGMPQEMLNKIFDPYFTTKSAGTGLGLATTHSIIVKHGGNITVESAEGEGTTFRMTFPATTASFDTEDNEHGDPGTAKSLNVLVMDDEEIVLNTIVRLLEHLGHQATETRDGTEAISAYARKMQEGQSFDLAIMDLTVAGGMGGTVAAAEILEIDPNAKLIVSSGYSSGAEMARFRELGFCARLEKPFRAADLEKTINEVVALNAGVS